MSDVLQINALSKSYNDVIALDNINLNIQKGLFGLLGPNGAGKSTLMRIIATILTPDRGEIMFDGIDVIAQPDEVRKKLGYLPQEFGVYPRVSAYELLDHLAILKGYSDRNTRHEAVLRLLEETNLYQDKDKAVSSFSGGMRQRFGIAQALLGNPELLIVDEPTAGLDPEERARFHELLLTLSDDKVIILSTHIVDDVSELCSNMAVLGEGRILLHGNPITLTAALEDKIWRRAITKFELPEMEQIYNVVSKKLFAGNTIVHVYAESPPAGFESAPVSLQDVYFHALDKQ
ncbi:MAG: ABC transporter ATP-binding protein [Pseudomonadota bacterium]